MERERETIARLLEDVAAGIRVLATRDGLALSERQVWERARNIVAGLMGNYRIVSFREDDEDEPEVRRRPLGLTGRKVGDLGHSDGLGGTAGGAPEERAELDEGASPEAGRKNLRVSSFSP